MDEINRRLQASLDAKNHYRDLLKKSIKGELVNGKKVSEADLDAAERLVREAEQDHAEERMRLDAEDAQLARRPSGRIAAGRGIAPSSLDETDAPALSALPALPQRTLAALHRLYPEASSDPEGRAENWRGVVAAALGGQPLHPAILAATATEGVPSDGGFAVTVEVARGIFSRAVEQSVWLRIGARLEPMVSEEKLVNALQDDDETDDAEATLKAAWTEETGTATEQLMKVRQVKLTARKLMVVAAASNELGDDAPEYITALEAALSRAIAKKLDRSILSGTGAGMPLGILNSPATITVSKEGGQAASTFIWENAVNMWARLAPGSHELAWWLINPTVLPQGLSMSLTIGTGGTQPRGAFEAGGPTGYMLLGRPVLVTSRIKVLGTKGDVILVDPTQLAVGVRRGIAIERSDPCSSARTGWRSAGSSAATRGRSGRRRAPWPKAARRSLRSSSSRTGRRASCSSPRSA